MQTANICAELNLDAIVEPGSVAWNRLEEDVRNFRIWSNCKMSVKNLDFDDGSVVVKFLKHEGSVARWQILDKDLELSIKIPTDMLRLAEPLSSSRSRAVM